eukprot:UN0304
MKPLAGVAWLQPLTSALFAAKLQVTFPLFTPPLTDACEALLGFSDQTRRLPRMLVKIAFAAVCTGLAVALHGIGNLTSAMAVTGYLFSTNTTLILPTAFYLKLMRFQLHWTRIFLSGVIFLSGFAIMFGGVWHTVTQVMDLVH